MIRFRIHQAVVLLIVCATLIGAAYPAFASDQDGISGYSMRLKFKEFSTDDNGGLNGMTASDPILVVTREDQAARVAKAVPINSLEFVLRVSEYWLLLRLWQ